MAAPPFKRQKLDVKGNSEDSSPFDMLPNEILEIPIKMAMKSMNTQERYNFLVDVLPKVSRRFRVIANHKSMQKDISPFEMLPDNLSEISIRMVLNGTSQFERNNFLVEDLAKVSSRFKALAALKSLWKGHVAIFGRTEHRNWVIRQYVNDGTTSVSITAYIGQQSLLAKDISTLAAKCPKLSTLNLRALKLECWPYFTSPWTSLKKLILVHVHAEFESLGWGGNANIFSNG